MLQQLYLARLEDVEDQQGKLVNQEACYSNYREVAGVQVPGKIVIKREGKLYVEAQNQDVKPVDKLADSVFGKP